MARTQTISIEPHDNIATDPAQFRVAAIEEAKCSLASYKRRDYYKITLVLSGRNRLLYANREIVLDQPALVFTNPLIPYSWEDELADHDGYFCVFTDNFLYQGGRIESLNKSSLFKPGGDPVCLLNKEQAAYIKSIFSRMRQEVDSEYRYKHELIRSQLSLLIHEAIKMQPPVDYHTPQNAAARISKLFLDLLEKQFPVESPRYALSLKKASDYAENLAVHVNHLNAAVQEMTGKSTTTHINERILHEAKQLLQHTDWSISDIAFSLGFEYTSYFNTFFKKHEGGTPGSIRKAL